MSSNLGVACRRCTNKKVAFCVCLSCFCCQYIFAIPGRCAPNDKNSYTFIFRLSFLHFNELLAHFIHSLLPLTHSRLWYNGPIQVEFIRTRNMMLFVYGIFTEHETTNEN